MDSGGPAAVVLRVRDGLAESAGAAVLVELLDGDVGHEPVRGGAVPVVLPGFEEHAVAGPDLLDGTALALSAPDAFGDVDGLSVWVGVPMGTCAGSEVNEPAADT